MRSKESKNFSHSEKAEIVKMLDVVNENKVTFAKLQEIPVTTPQYTLQKK